RHGDCAVAMTCSLSTRRANNNPFLRRNGGRKQEADCATAQKACFSHSRRWKKGGCSTWSHIPSGANAASMSAHTYWDPPRQMHARRLRLGCRRFRCNAGPYSKSDPVGHNFHLNTAALRHTESALSAEFRAAWRLLVIAYSGKYLR